MISTKELPQKISIYWWQLGEDGIRRGQQEDHRKEEQSNGDIAGSGLPGPLQALSKQIFKKQEIISKRDIKMWDAKKIEKDALITLKKKT